MAFISRAYINYMVSYNQISSVVTYKLFRLEPAIIKVPCCIPKLQRKIVISKKNAFGVRTHSRVSRRSIASP